MAFDGDQFFVVTIFQKIIAGEFFFAGRNFLEVFWLEELPIQGLEVGHPIVKLFLRNLVIFGNTVQKVKNGEIF